MYCFKPKKRKTKLLKKNFLYQIGKDQSSVNSNRLHIYGIFENIYQYFNNGISIII